MTTEMLKVQISKESEEIAAFVGEYKENPLFLNVYSVQKEMNKWPVWGRSFVSRSSDELPDVHDMHEFEIQVEPYFRPHYKNADTIKIEREMVEAPGGETCLIEREFWIKTQGGREAERTLAAFSLLIQTDKDRFQRLSMFKDDPIVHSTDVKEFPGSIRTYLLSGYSVRDLKVGVIT